MSSVLKVNAGLS